MAVVRGGTMNSPGSVAIYRDGIRRPATTNPINLFGILHLAFGANASTVYATGEYGPFLKLAVGQGGVSEVATTNARDIYPPGVENRYLDLDYAAGRVFLTNGLVLNPEVPALVGSLPGVDGGVLRSLVVADRAAGRVYYLSGDIFRPDEDRVPYTVRINAYDVNTLAHLGSYEVPNVKGRVRNFVRWGANGLAFNSTAGRVYLSRTTLIPSNEPVAFPDFHSLPPATTPPVALPAAVREVALPNNDIVYDPLRRLIYASVPGDAGERANTVTALDPATGRVVSSIPVGPDPGKLAISDDARFLYVGLNAGEAIRRIDLRTGTPDLHIPLDRHIYQRPLVVNDMAVQPGNPERVLVNQVHAGGEDFGTLTAYEHGVKRFSISLSTSTLEFGTLPTELYRIARRVSGAVPFQRFKLGDAGVEAEADASYLMGGDFQHAGGLFYSPNGPVADPIGMKPAGRFVWPAEPSFPAAAVDTRAGRAYFIIGLSLFPGVGSTWRLRVYDTRTFLEVGSVSIPGVKGAVTPLVRWGENGLAFATHGQIFIVESPAVSGGRGPTPWVPHELPETAVELQTWTEQGQTFALARLKLPDGNFRVADWGDVSHAGADHLAHVSVERSEGAAAPQSARTAEHIWNLGVLAPGAHTLTLRTGTLSAFVTFNVGGGTTPPPASVTAASRFVRQHYLDFLGREPDAAGLSFWTNDIIGCGSDATCAGAKRVNVSAAFFLSIEFQETGYFVYRMHKAAYGDATPPGVQGSVPIIRFEEFLPDTLGVGRGVRVGVGDWQRQLEENKNVYAAEFASRRRFLDAFPASMTPEQFVVKLDLNAGGVLSPAERAPLINELTADNTAAGRGRVLRRVAENASLRDNEFRRAFVLMQYFGYLRRNADAPGFGGQPDPEFKGFRFWLDKLNQFDGDFVRAEMVRAFIESIEYNQRFSQ